MKGICRRRERFYRFENKEKIDEAPGRIKDLASSRELFESRHERSFGIWKLKRLRIVIFVAINLLF